MEIKKKYNFDWKKWKSEWKEIENIRKENMNCFVSYIEEKSPDIIVLQEFEYTYLAIDNCLEKLKNNYYVVEPYSFKYDKDINKNVIENSIVLMLIKRQKGTDFNYKSCAKPKHLKVREYRWLEKEYSNYSILGVHIPAEEDYDNCRRDDMRLKVLDSLRMLDSLLINSLNRMEDNKKVIVIGDMNANLEKADYTVNFDRLNLLKHLYVGGRYIFDAWERCIKYQKAYTIIDN